nr:Gag-Pol polyprotein [Tanacetum cinerariifolium]
MNGKSSRLLTENRSNLIIIRHVTIVRQTKNLHEADFTQIYDFLKMNQGETQLLIAQKEEAGIQLQAEEFDFMAGVGNLDEIEEVNANCILMANLQHTSTSGTQLDKAPVYDADGSAEKNMTLLLCMIRMGQDRQMQMIGGNGGNQFRQYAGQNARNLNGYNAVQNVENQVAQNPRVQNDGIHNQIRNGNLVAVCAEGNAAGHNGNQIRCYNCRGVGHFARDCTVRLRRRDAAYLQTQLLIAQKEEAGIQLQAEEYDLMAAAVDLDEIEEVNANCILMANLQQASSLGTQTDSAPVYDTDGSAEVHEHANYDNNEIFNMFTQEEQYTELLEPIPEPQQVPQNENEIISENVRNQVAQNPRVQNDEIQNQIGNGNLVAVRAEGNAAGHNGNQIRYRSAEVHENYDNNEIFHMFTQEEQYTELLEPILEPQQVPQNHNIVISEATNVKQGGETVEQHSANFEETRALYESLYHNLVVKVEKVNSFNHKLKETNADLTTKLA